MSIRQALTSSTSAYLAGNRYVVENLGQTVTSDIPLVDARLHLKDGTLLNKSGIYTNFVDYMEDFITNNPNADNFCTEQEWQSSVTTYGCCGCYVVDTTNHTVRLPKVSEDNDRYLIKAYTSNGITCRIYSDGWCEQEGNTVKTAASQTVNLLETYSDTNYNVVISPYYPSTNQISYIDGLYQKNTSSFVVYSSNIGSPYSFNWKTEGYISLPTQTPVKKYNYVCVATSVKQPAVVEIDNVVTDLNGKADVDLTNVSNTSGFRRLVEVSPKSILPSWYKVYDEYDPATGEFIGKWCEQGGYATEFTQDLSTIYLLKEFTDTNYSLFTLLKTNEQAGGVGSSFADCGYYSKSTYSFVKSVNRIYQKGFDWVACGYIS